MGKRKSNGAPAQQPEAPQAAGVSPELEAELRKAQVAASRPAQPSLMDLAEERAEAIAAIADSSPGVGKEGKKLIQDHYANSLSSVGNDDKVQSFSSYGFSADTLNWPLWLALYNDSWVFRRAIDKPAQDEVTSGFTLRGSRDYTEVYAAFAKYKNDMTDLLTWGALFGGSIAIMLFKGCTDEMLRNPLKKSFIRGRAFKLYVVDRWYGVSPSVDDLVSNMKDIDYGKPKWYDVTMADGQTRRVHHSWVIRYEHRTAPRLIKSGQLQGWGYAEGSHIINELARDDQLKTSITSLVNKSLIEVIHMAGMRGVFMGTDKGNETQLRKRLEMVNWGRTYNSLTFLDKDDEYEHFELTGLAGLADLMEKNMWLISAALEMQGVLFGDLKGGLSQESDAFARYAKTIKRRCDAYYRPALKKLLKIIFLTFGWEESPVFDFESLNKIEESKQMMQAAGDLARLLDQMMTGGIISKYQYAKTMKGFLNTGSVSLDFSEELMNKLRLDEEQAILDTIKEIGVKRHEEPRRNERGGIDMVNPFGEPPALGSLGAAEPEGDEIGQEESPEPAQPAPEAEGGSASEDGAREPGE